MEESQVVSKENKDEANGLRRKPEITPEKRAERSRHREFTKLEAKGQCEDQGPQHPTDLCDLTLVRTKPGGQQGPGGKVLSPHFTSWHKGGGH